MMEGDKVSHCTLRVQACALGQSSAAILKDAIVGTTLGELIDARDAFRAMLKENGATPKGRFDKLALLKGVVDYPARHTSTLLAFDAAVEAVKMTLDPVL